MNPNAENAANLHIPHVVVSHSQGPTMIVQKDKYINTTVLCLRKKKEIRHFRVENRELHDSTTHQACAYDGAITGYVGAAAVETPRSAAGRVGCCRTSDPAQRQQPTPS